MEKNFKIKDYCLRGVFIILIGLFIYLVAIISSAIEKKDKANRAIFEKAREICLKSLHSKNQIWHPACTATLDALY